MQLCSCFPIVSTEDGMEEDDWSGWQLTKRLGDTVQLGGDDLFVTQSLFLRKGVETKYANAILIKPNPNQVGMLTETFETFFWQVGLYGTVISHRSG
ncbi:hypothetical protein [Candidatus Ichthyocystis sparus]|uniref:hypothetical protein n=1 Tax=Candidatus Ichthyocystis sparus TaxID=1561004 RepID=UPI001F5E8F0A|nr:hypothetical protein [Candidatus Ichthyocystis sparus]